LPRADPARVDPDDPETYRVAGYVWNTWHAPGLWDIPRDADLAAPETYPDWFAAAAREARLRCPDTSVHAEVFSPFTHLLELFGYQEALIALLEAPGTCHRLLDRFTAIVAAQVCCLARHSPDAILISSAFAGAGFISRPMYREFVVPYERRVVHGIHDANITAYVHTCGAIGDRLDLMSDTGVDGIDTLDPPPLGTAELTEVKARYGERFFLKGNLDAVNEMLRADDEAFDRAVIQRLQIGKPGSGYILSSACSVPPHVQPARLRRMVALAEQYGGY
jgi:uroporphyrinogen-III decarboxylase